MVNQLPAQGNRPSLANASEITTVPDLIAWIKAAAKYYLDGKHLRNFEAYSPIELGLTCMSFVGLHRSQGQASVSDEIAGEQSGDTRVHCEFWNAVDLTSMVVSYLSDSPALEFDFRFRSRQLTGGDFNVFRAASIRIPLDHQTGITSAIFNT